MFRDERSKCDCILGIVSRSLLFLDFESEYFVLGEQMYLSNYKRRPGFSDGIFQPPDLTFEHLPDITQQKGLTGTSMTDTNSSQNFSQNPDTQEKRVSGDDITPSQEQPRLPETPPKSLVEWLVRVHLRLMALEQEKSEDTG